MKNYRFPVAGRTTSSRVTRPHSSQLEASGSLQLKSLVFAASMAAVLLASLFTPTQAQHLKVEGLPPNQEKAKQVRKTSMPIETKSGSSDPLPGCRYWHSRVDRTFARSDENINEANPKSILEGIGCLLRMKGNKNLARFSGVTHLYVSQTFEPATSEVGALYYISYLYTQKWDHADAIALENSNGEINDPQDILIAYQSYQRWFEQVKSVGLAQARQMNLRPLKDTNIRWY
jgi:hypothetical protein